MKKFRVDIETSRDKGISREYNAPDWYDALMQSYKYIEELRRANNIDRTAMYPDAYQVYDIEQQLIVWDYFNGVLAV